MPESTVILDAMAIQRALARIAHEIAERNEVGAEVVLVGIPVGGDHSGVAPEPAARGNLASTRPRRHLGREHAP